MASNRPAKTKPVLLILGVVALSFILLSVISAFNIEGYRWVFEVAILFVAVGVVYYILRTDYYGYTYVFIESNLIFKQTMGKGERYVFALDLKNLLRVIPEEEAKAEIAERGLKAVAKYYVPSDEHPVWGIIYYDETDKCEKILTFKPDEEFFEILSKKTIDNRG
jgi:hypothetical protein